VEYPHTISYCIRKAIQISSFFEFPTKNRPPENIWFNEEALEEWFKNIENDIPNSIEIDEDDIE
jgi:hypothetical protein